MTNTVTQDLATNPLIHYYGERKDIRLALSQPGPAAFRVEVAQVSGAIALIEHEGLTRSYPTEAHARLVARQYATLFKAGWTLDEVAALTRNATILPAEAVDEALDREMRGGHGQIRNATRRARLTTAQDLLNPAAAARRQALAARWAA